MPSQYFKDDPINGYVDLDAEYITEEELVERHAQGNLFAWGYAGNPADTYPQGGLLGLSESVHRSSPVQVGSLSDWRQVSSDNLGTAAIKTDGTLWTWGQNRYGSLGDPDPTLFFGTNRSSPVQVGTSSWIQVVAHSQGATALRADGTLWWWGARVGSGLSSDARSSPTNVGFTSETYKRLFSLGSCMFATTHDRALYAWGINSSGQLGNSSTLNRITAVRVGTDTGWKQVTGDGSNTTYALKDDGSIWAWGNWGNWLGSAFNFQYRSSPVQITSWGKSWRFINANNGNIALIAYDGTLWMIGYNSIGQLGDNTQSAWPTGAAYSPKQVGSMTNWKAVLIGQASATTAAATVLAIKTDGTLWGWGSGEAGRLGNGDTIHRSSPVQIGKLSHWKSLSESQTLVNQCFAISYAG